MAAHKRGRICWRPLSPYRRCWRVCALGQVAHILTVCTPAVSGPGATPRRVHWPSSLARRDLRLSPSQDRSNLPIRCSTSRTARARAISSFCAIISSLKPEHLGVRAVLHDDLVFEGFAFRSIAACRQDSADFFDSMDPGCVKNVFAQPRPLAVVAALQPQNAWSSRHAANDPR